MEATEPKIIEEKTYEYAIVQDADGKVIFNAFQQDKPVVRRRYDDGYYDVIEQKTGKLIVPRYSSLDDALPKCQHCGESPW